MYRPLNDAHGFILASMRPVGSTLLCCLGKAVATNETGFREQLFNITLIQFLLVNLNIVGIGVLLLDATQGHSWDRRITLHMKT